MGHKTVADMLAMTKSLQEDLTRISRGDLPTAQSDDDGHMEIVGGIELLVRDLKARTEQLEADMIELRRQHENLVQFVRDEYVGKSALERVPEAQTHAS